jgi:hypothetical protein
LTLWDEKRQVSVLASICGAWRDTPWSLGLSVAVLHYRAAYHPARVIVDDDGGLLLLVPQQLVSSSVVASAAWCTRRSVLDELFLSVCACQCQVLQFSIHAQVPPPSSVRSSNGDKYRESAVSGQMSHELFQRALMTNDFSVEG